MQIGSIQLRNPFALAPMAGLSDVPFRTLAWRFGAGYLVSEMVSSQPQLWETGKSRLRRIPVVGAKPVAVQIAGTDPATMAEAAHRHVQEGAEVIDINFGCPAKKVCRKAAGSALLGDLDLIGRIVAEVVEKVDVPVTVKTRTGLHPGDDIGVQAGVVAARSGASMIVMHGRSRACKFAGAVDYAPVARLVEQVDVPVMVNGDIDSAVAVQRALDATGAQGVMLGRGAMGQPWLFAELTGLAVPSLAQRWEIIAEHLAMMHEFYGERAGVGIGRKHVIAYLQRLGFEKDGFKEFLKLQSARQQLAWLSRAAARMDSALSRAA